MDFRCASPETSKIFGIFYQTSSGVITSQISVVTNKAVNKAEIPIVYEHQMFGVKCSELGIKSIVFQRSMHNDMPSHNV